MSITSCAVRGSAWAVFLLLVGCTSVPADLGRDDVDKLVSTRGRPSAAAAPADAAAQLASLTATPLSADTAVRIAFLNSPRLKAVYAGLGFAAADVYEAGRMSNPRLSVADLDSNVAGEGAQLTVGLALSFTGP